MTKIQAILSFLAIILLTLILQATNYHADLTAKDYVILNDSTQTVFDTVDIRRFK